MPTTRSRRQRHDEPLRLPDTVHLSARGMAKVLGEPDAWVMQAVWELARPVPARAVYERVRRRHRGVSPLQVITVLNKLVRRGVLHRARHDDLLHYEARYTREEFAARAARRVVEGIVALGPGAVAAALVDVLIERSPETLAELARRARRAASEHAAPVDPAAP